MRRKALGAMLVVALVSGPAALGQSIPVQTGVNGGTRSFALKTIGGAPLTSLSLGSLGASPFKAEVVDTDYDRTGYQVSATMSNLYGYSSGVWDCGKVIASSALSLDALPTPNVVSGVAAQLEPVWQLSGTIDAALALVLGLAGATALSVPDVPSEVNTQSITGIFTGLEDTLPMQLATPSTTVFSTAAAHTDCDPTPGGTATSAPVMTGSASTLPALLSQLTTQVQDLADVDNGGTITGAELVASGLVDASVLAPLVRSALGTLGVNLGVLDTLIGLGTVTYDMLFALLTATIDPVLSLTGQGGSYSSLARLNASIPESAASGTYRGTMTVTLVDVP